MPNWDGCGSDTPNSFKWRLVVATTAGSFRAVATAAVFEGFGGRIGLTRNFEVAPVLCLGPSSARPPKTNLVLRPWRGPAGALSKDQVIIGSRRLNGGVHVVKRRQYRNYLDLHISLVHSSVVDFAALWLYDNARTNFLQLAAGLYPMQEYARGVLSQNNTCWASS